MLLPVVTVVFCKQSRRRAFILGLESSITGIESSKLTLVQTSNNFLTLAGSIGEIHDHGSQRRIMFLGSSSGAWRVRNSIFITFLAGAYLAFESFSQTQRCCNIAIRG